MSQRFAFGAPSGGEYMPTLSFVLKDETTQNETPLLSAIVDTGADGTIIPISVLEAQDSNRAAKENALSPHKPQLRQKLCRAIW